MYVPCKCLLLYCWKYVGAVISVVCICVVANMCGPHKCLLFCNCVVTKVCVLFSVCNCFVTNMCVLYKCSLVCCCVFTALNMCVLYKCLLFVVLSSQAHVHVACIKVCWFLVVSSQTCVPYNCLLVCCYIFANLCFLSYLFVVCFSVVTNMSILYKCWSFVYCV